jgi:hypothetical protein
MPAELQPSPEDVELVARALAEQLGDEVFTNPIFAADHWDDSRRVYLSDGEAVVAALASAGRLTPNGTTEQFGVGERGRRVMPYTTEAVARSKAQQPGLLLFRRWVGPWLSIGEEK